MPTMTPATTTTMTPLRICWRRFCAWPRRPRRASRAARWRALLSLGTARALPNPGGSRIAPRAQRRRPSGPRRRAPGAGSGRKARCAVCSLVRMPLVVQKFGGTSVGDADRIRAVADHIARTRRQGSDVVAVVSAMGKTTDDLIHLADSVSATQPPREYDMLVSTGERISMSLLVMALADLGVEAPSFTGSQVGIITDNDHTRAKIIEVKGDRLREALAAGKVPVVAGFQGVSERAGDHDAGPGRLRRHRRSAGRRPRRRRLRDLHRRHRGLHGRSPHRARGAPHQPDLVRRDARDGGDRRPGAHAARRRVRPQPQRPAARAQQLHLGARHLGGGGGCRHGRSRRHRGHPRHLGGQGHRQRGARPSRRRRPALPGAGRQVDQRGHDRPEHVRPRHHRHLVHRADRPTCPCGRDVAGPRRRAGRLGRDRGCRRGPGLAGRGRA